MLKFNFSFDVLEIHQKTDPNTKLMHWLPGCQVHFDFFTTFRNAYLIRFGKWVMPRPAANKAGILENFSACDDRELGAGHTQRCIMEVRHVSRNYMKT